MHTTGTYTEYTCTTLHLILVIVELHYNSMELCLGNFFSNMTAPFYFFLCIVLMVIVVDQMFVTLQNSYVEILSSNVKVLGSGGFGEEIRTS